MGIACSDPSHAHCSLPLRLGVCSPCRLPRTSTTSTAGSGTNFAGSNLAIIASSAELSPHRRSRSTRKRVRRSLSSSIYIRNIDTATLHRQIFALERHHGSRAPQRALRELSNIIAFAVPMPPPPALRPYQSSQAQAYDIATPKQFTYKQCSRCGNHCQPHHSWCGWCHNDLRDNPKYQHRPSRNNRRRSDPPQPAASYIPPMPVVDLTSDDMIDDTHFSEIIDGEINWATPPAWVWNVWNTPESPEAKLVVKHLHESPEAPPPWLFHLWLLGNDMLNHLKRPDKPQSSPSLSAAVDPYGGCSQKLPPPPPAPVRPQGSDNNANGNNNSDPIVSPALSPSQTRPFDSRVPMFQRWSYKSDEEFLKVVINQSSQVDLYRPPRWFLNLRFRPKSKEIQFVNEDNPQFGSASCGRIVTLHFCLISNRPRPILRLLVPILMITLIRSLTTM